MLSLTKRTYHFTVNPKQKRTLYLALVRSQFEHCSEIWRPVISAQIDKFVRIQKKAIKWILNEQFLSYSEYDVYIKKCRDLNILLISKKFDLSDLVLFHKIVNGYLPIKLPEYISKFNGVSRTRNHRLDSESYVCNLNFAQTKKIYKRNPFFDSFFYRTIHIWNNLPFEIRYNESISCFKSLTADFLWKEVFDFS